MHRRLARLSLAAAAALTVVGCTAGSGHGGAKSTGAGDPTAARTTGLAATCSPAELKTRTAGTLTVATDTPAYEPWFVANQPANGKGFESAVAYAVAGQLGYTRDQVAWVAAPVDSAVAPAPAPKNFDFDINQVAITPARAKAVDFSTGYYDVAQAVVTLRSNKFANASSIVALEGATLGAQRGTAGADAISQAIAPNSSPREYPTEDDAVQALRTGAIDGLVVDLPAALFIVAADLDDAKIVGQLPVSASPDQFGLVLAKGSPLTSCVSKAVDALRADGTLATLQKKWLTTSAGAPELS